MSFNLWKLFLEDDIDGFRQYLARATYAQGSSKIGTATAAIPSIKSASPGVLATSPRTPTRPRKVTGHAPPSSTTRSAGPTITRADINARDSSGRTILHIAASAHNPNAVEFVKALLEVSVLDLYMQDFENGWTALHRALYAGNIDIAQAILARDTFNAADYPSQSRTQIGGLVKIKDHEGHSPFEVFGLTIAPRRLVDTSHSGRLDSADDEDDNSVDFRDDVHENDRVNRQLRPHIDLQGDEAFAFGSNRNLSLGLGDEDDRQYPERIHLERPQHLLHRIWDDYKTQRHQHLSSDELASSMQLHQTEQLPAIIRHKPIRIQDIVMAKLHTAVVTDDPVSNLHICGFGQGGRLGTGDETTRFKYVCIQGGGLASRRVVSIALGQDHCIAICSSGEVFTWGSNKYGQLGYVLPEVAPQETPIQLTPRQLYGLVKKETIIGAAASAIHSVIYTASSLYTFGKNEGQLGLMDADARSLQIQDIPRRVGVSLLQSSIKAVSAIDRATTILLESRDVIVFTHYGFTKVVFPLEESNLFLSQALSTRLSKEVNTICKITSGGNTVGALSTYGQVFTVDVPKPAEMVPSNVSTTNPAKARNALPTPSRIWTIRKSHMSATDFAMGQDGSIILCTEAGAVWRKEKRANIKSVKAKASDNKKPMDYKFVRVPHLTRAIAVRSNAFGAFAAVRKDCNVTREQISVDLPTLSSDIFPLLSFHAYGSSSSEGEDEYTPEPQLRFWLPSNQKPNSKLIKSTMLRKPLAEDDFLHMSKRFEPLSETQYDAWVTSNLTKVRIPVHSTLLKARSKILRSRLAEFDQTYYFSIPDVMSIEYGQNGEMELTFLGADFLTLVNLVFYLYTDNIIDVWHHTSKALPLAARYRQIRVELMKIASNLDLRRLEKAVRVMVDPSPCLMEDMEIAYMDLDLYSNADVAIDLADGAERSAHSLILSSRCPFFDGLFHGRAAGLWIQSRTPSGDGGVDQTRVDLKHVDVNIFDIVLRHIYADTADELFDTVITEDLDGFIDIVIDVMSVANELMLDRLVQICQSVVGKYVTPRNVSGLLNTIAESSVDAFKVTALEYLCLNLEGMLEQRLLADLDPHLLGELVQVVQENQLAFMPIVRSERAQHELFERYPNLAELVEKSRQRRIDSMRLQNRLVDENTRPTPKARIGSYDKLGSSPVGARKMDMTQTEENSGQPSPSLTPNHTTDDLPFVMDEDAMEDSFNHLGKSKSPSLQPRDSLLRLGSEDVFANSVTSYGLSPQQHTGDQTSDLRDRSPVNPQQNTQSVSRAHGFELPKAVWSHSSFQEKKADLKQIMEQASVARVSNLTQAMKADGPFKTPTHKVSQKERKRQQQQQQQQIRSPEEAPADLAESGSTPSSPWAKIVPTAKSSVGSFLTEHTTSPNTPRTPQRPRMPLRQAADSNPSLTQRMNLEIQKQNTPRTSLGHIDQKANPTVHSVRHTPLTRSTSFIDARTSMADILAQQQGEKVAIKEAVAKRSLQDIQQEQEFQEWWDQESRRVQEEAARSTSTATKHTDRAGRDKANRRKAPGRGGATSTPKDREQDSQGQGSTTSLQAESRSTRGGGPGRGRGHTRGRDRRRPSHGPVAQTSK